MHDWLLFLPQLPATPSSLRVLVWRRLRAAGAVGLQHGVWVLPHTEPSLTTCHTLLQEIAQQGGTATVFVAQPLDADVHSDIVARSRADRDHEYTEFCTQAEVLLAEVTRETVQNKLTFAELEELEHDIQKLETWLYTIQGRDFFHAAHALVAQASLASCQQAVTMFAHAVYAREGVLPPAININVHPDPSNHMPQEEG